MRQYIRHPFEIPISYRVDDHGMIHKDDMQDISEGGLCFQADHFVEIGLEIMVNIDVQKPPFEAKGIVMWCRPSETHFDVGVQFDDTTTEFSMRMVEQICYIEQYRKDVLHYENREISPQVAALEWISKYASTFPR